MTTSKCRHPEKYTNEDGSCAVCLANEGPQSCAEIARRMGVSKQYVHQIEQTALRKLRQALRYRYPGIESAVMDWIADVDRRRYDPLELVDHDVYGGSDE